MGLVKELNGYDKSKARNLIRFLKKLIFDVFVLFQVYPNIARHLWNVWWMHAC